MSRQNQIDEELRDLKLRFELLGIISIFISLFIFFF